MGAMDAANSSAASKAPSRDDIVVRYAWLSLAVSIVVIVIKAGAWWVTGAVGLLSDAAESLVNVAAAIVALSALRVARKPADSNHHYGHSKAEFFSAAIEGQLIFVAACVILYTSVTRFLDPQPLDQLGVGLALSVLASIIGGVVAIMLIRAGRRHNSAVLHADGHHLLTDLYTSLGVIVGVLAVWVTGWERLDPLIAFVMGLNILRIGWKLVNSAASALLDESWPADEQQRLADILAGYKNDEVDLHGLRTRHSGTRRFAEVHVLVPGEWTVSRGHDVVENMEDAVRAAFPEAVLTVHLEPIEDPRAYGDYETEVRLS